MAQFPSCTSKDVERYLKNKLKGKYKRQKGSHRIWRVPGVRRLIVVPAQKQDMNPKHVKNIVVRELERPIEEFVKFLQEGK